MRLRDLFEHLYSLYGRRNRIFLPSLLDRVAFLNLAIGDLQDAIRKEEDLKIFEIALARVVSRVACIAEHFRDLPLIESLCQKYPAGRCSYCQESPCACPERRPGYVLADTILVDQLDWSLRDWAGHLEVLYGVRNRQNGIENVINRLFKEISEIFSLTMDIPFTKPEGTLDDIEREFALELADTFSWTMAVANMVGVDIEKAVLDRFGGNCWKCKKDPCGCTQFNVVPVDWRRLA